MTTTLPTSTPVSGETTEPTSRGWAVAGAAAGVAGIVSIVGSSLSGAVYERANWGDAEAVAADMTELGPQILLFHTATMVSCVLLVVFAAGLHRQLRRRTGPDSLLPGVALGGLALVCVAQLMGAGLTTEFGFAFAAPPEAFVPESVVFFGHWIGTIPWLWGGAGLTALAMAGASFRYGAYPRWIAWTSVVLGGLALVCVAQLMGAGLTTEFGFAFAAPPEAFVPEAVVFFGHWVGTIPWLWGGAGLTALAMAGAAFRYGAYPRWIAWTSVVLGGLTALFMVSPLQYMAGMTGPLWLTVVATGLALTRRAA